MHKEVLLKDGASEELLENMKAASLACMFI
jgi:hypothetical protein